MMDLKEAAAVMIAASNGAEIEYRSFTCPTWYPWNIKGYASGYFNFSDLEYRVKPEKRHWVIRQGYTQHHTYGSQSVSPEIHEVKPGFNDLEYWFKQGFTHVVEV